MDTTKNAVSVFDKNAEQYKDKFMNVDEYGRALNVFCDTVANEQAAILDVACGPGNITRYLLQQHPGYNILGTDLSPNMLKLAGELNPDARFQLLDTRAITTLQKEFDGIVCGFGIPYLSKEEVKQFIADCARLLKQGGALYISTMEDDHANSGIEQNAAGEELYIYYYQSEFIVDLLLQNGFEIVEVMKQDFINDIRNGTDMMIIARHC